MTIRIIGIVGEMGRVHMLGGKGEVEWDRRLCGLGGVDILLRVRRRITHIDTISMKSVILINHNQIDIRGGLPPLVNNLGQNPKWGRKATGTKDAKNTRRSIGHRYLTTSIDYR